MLTCCSAQRAWNMRNKRRANDRCPVHVPNALGTCATNVAQMIVVPCRGRSSLRATGMPDCRSPREQLHRIDQLARSDSADTDLLDRLVVRKHQLLTTKCRVVPDTVSDFLLGW